MMNSYMYCAKMRGKIKIIYDILKTIWKKNNAVLLTHLMYASNLSYNVLDKYLKELIAKNNIVTGSYKEANISNSSSSCN